MSVAFPASPSPQHRHPTATRRSWVVGYTVETVEMAPQQNHAWARDAAWDAKRLEGPVHRVPGAERSLRVPPPLELHEVPGPDRWHQAGMPLPTDAFLAMRDATRHLR